MKQLVLNVVAALAVIAFAGCGGGDELDDVRASAYEMAQTEVRDAMKIPKSTQFPEMPPFEEFEISETKGEEEGKGSRTYEHDSVSFTLLRDDNGEFGPHSPVSVTGYYESQNKMGVMLPGEYNVIVTDADDDPELRVASVISLD